MSLNIVRSETRVLFSIALWAMLVMLAMNARAFGQFQLVDQTRQLTANAITNPGSFGTQSNNADSVTTAGVYNKTLNAAKTDSIPYPGIPSMTEVFNVTSSAEQNSNVSSALLSAASTVAASAQMSLSTNSFSIDAFGQSGYKVDFTVNAPTPFTIGGDLTLSGHYHLGPLEVVLASLTLSSSASGTPLYSVSDQLTLQPQDTLGKMVDDPLAFTTILSPGQTYMLNASASADSTRGPLASNQNGAAGAGFSFTATPVPEPGAAATIAAAALTASLASNRCHRAARRASIQRAA
jgi:hypothetical protein